MLTRRAKVYSSSCSQTVIDVDTTEKLITSACCDRQHAHAYLQPFSRKTGQQRQKWLLLGTAFWCPRAQVSLNLENRDMDRRNLRLMPKISHAACLCLSQLILAQFALKTCLADRNRQKSITKPPILTFKVIQGHSIRCQSRASVRLPISD